MENKIVFRNHISVVLENTVRVLWIVLFAFVGNFLGESENMEVSGDLWFPVGIALLILGVLVAWQLMVWAKTHIILHENTITVECKMLNHKKNTIGIQNVSNVNLEQNLFEMMIGCCKVKLDTNSLSTANETDVKIVLKKRDAERFKEIVLGKLHNQDEATEQQVEKEQEEKLYFEAKDKDIIQHGIFSVNLITLFVCILTVFSTVILVIEMTRTGLGKSFLEIVSSVFVIIWFSVILLWRLLKGFIQYIDFKVERKEQQIHISYGVLKKVNYSIPVDKINALILSQTGLARVGKRYMVEVINVGMGDDQSETNSFFLPYAKKEQIEERIKQLLPEFQDSLQIQEERQPKCVWVVWMLPTVIYLLFAGALIGMIAKLLPELLGGVIGGIVGLSICLVAIRFVSYLTVGSKIEHQFLKVVSGRIARKSVLIKLDKIQFVTLKQNFLAKRFGIQKGTIHLLAALKYQLHTLPYFKGEGHIFKK